MIAGWPYAEHEANKDDVEGNYLEALDLAPEFAERIRGATREARFAGTAVPNYFRDPTVRAGRSSATPGTTRTSSPRRGSWTRSGTPSCARPRCDQSFSGARSFDEAMAGYQATRDEQVLPMFEFTCQLATLEPPPPDLQQLLAAAHGNQEAMDAFARVNAGVTSPAEFFSEENVGRIFAAAQDRRAVPANAD